VNFTSPAVLLWQAHASFIIATDVEVQVPLDPGGVAQLSVVRADDFWGLVVLDSPFQLAFEDGSVVDVALGDPDDSGVFPVWEWDEQEGDHRRPCPDCTGDLVRTETVIGADDRVTLHDACSACGRDVVRSLSPPS
jgi:hypothetical protein